MKDPATPPVLAQVRRRSGGLGAVGCAFSAIALATVMALLLFQPG